MLLKFTINHAAACERDIRGNIYKSAAVGRERRRESADAAVRTKSRAKERDVVFKVDETFN